MNKIVSLCLLLLAVLVFGPTACKKEESSTVPAGTVKASEAYLTHFGEPPVPDKGQCFARVGFYPLSGSTGKVAAMPFFLFKETDQMGMLLERLVTTKPAYLEQSVLRNPFPPGSSVRIAFQSGGRLDLELSTTASSSPQDLSAMAAALTETAVQFDDVETVRIFRDGAPLPGMPEGGFAHDAERIEPPAPPTLLLVVGAWEKGERNPEEILADFDRPVKIDSFSLRNAAGQEIKGDYFTSAFDMAVVIRPESPSAIEEGMSLQAEWVVVDRMGRRGEGAGTFTLERHEHADGF